MTDKELDTTHVKILQEPSRVARLAKGSGRSAIEVLNLIEVGILTAAASLCVKSCTCVCVCVSTACICMCVFCSKGSMHGTDLARVLAILAGLFNLPTT
jgi:hypothetical protein